MTTQLEDIPSPVLISILSRLPSSADLATCRLVSRNLLYLSRLVTAVSVQFNPQSQTRFKNRIFILVSLLASSLLSLSISSRPATILPASSDQEEDLGYEEGDDLHISSVEFMSTWLTLIGPKLKELCVVDYWAQSCFRKSDALHLISSLCKNLNKLEIKNAWLSVNGIKQMPNLTNLTLNFIRIDDEDLDKINQCFLSLQFLSLIDVGGLKNPKINLSHLKYLTWKVSNVPLSLSINAPNLIYLNLSCVEPKFLSLDTPSLSTFVFTIKKASGDIRLESVNNLRNVTFRSLDMLQLFRVFQGTQSVKTLEIDTPINEESNELNIKSSIIVDSFGNLDELKLVNTARKAINKIECDKVGFLKRFEIPVEECDFDDFGGIFELLKMCGPSCKVALLFHADVDEMTKESVINKYAIRFQEFIWM